MRFAGHSMRNTQISPLKALQKFSPWRGRFNYTTTLSVAIIFPSPSIALNLDSSSPTLAHSSYDSKIERGGRFHSPLFTLLGLKKFWYCNSFGQLNFSCVHEILALAYTPGSFYIVYRVVFFYTWLCSSDPHSTFWLFSEAKGKTFWALSFSLFFCRSSVCYICRYISGYGSFLKGKNHTQDSVSNIRIPGLLVKSLFWRKCSCKFCLWRFSGGCRKQQLHCISFQGQLHTKWDRLW